MPLLNPANYMLQLPDPAEAARKNLELGLGLMGAQQTAQQAQQRSQLFDMQIQAAQREQMQAEQQQVAKQALRAKLAALGQNMTPAGIAAVATEHPELTENLWKNYTELDADSQKAQLSVAQKIHFASLSGKPDIAAKVALDEAQASENSGDKNRAADLRGLAKQIEQDPKTMDFSVGAFISRVKGADEYLKSFGNIATNRKAAADATTADAQAEFARPQQIAELRQKSAATTSSLASAANSRDAITDRTAGRALDEKRFLLEQKKADLEELKANRDAAKLDPDAKKLINESTDAIQKASALGDKATGLLSFIERNRTLSGAEASIAETWKSFAGSQDEVTKFRSEYDELKNAIAMLRLPPGTASEKDVSMALEGMPSRNANSDQIAQFLRGFQKLQKFAVDAHRVKRAWVGANGSTLPATRDFTAAGREVKAGQELESVLYDLAPKAAPVSGATRGPSRPVAFSPAEASELAALRAMRGAK